MNLIHVSQSRDKNGDLSSNNIAVGIDLLDFHQNHEWDVMVRIKKIKFRYTSNLYLKKIYLGGAS